MVLSKHFHNINFGVEKLRKCNNTIKLITLVILTWKWMSLFLRKNHLLRWWDCLPLLNWIGALTLSLLLKLPPRKLELWFVHLDCLNWFHFLILEGGLLIISIDCMTFLSAFLDVIRMYMLTVSFLAQLDSGILCPWNYFLWPTIQMTLSLELTDTF